MTKQTSHLYAEIRFSDGETLAVNQEQLKNIMEQAAFNTSRVLRENLQLQLNDLIKIDRPEFEVNLNELNAVVRSIEEGQKRLNNTTLILNRIEVAELLVIPKPPVPDDH